MPNSLKVMIKKLAHKGCISSAECDKLLMKLDGHTVEIRAKTVEEFTEFIDKHTHDDDGIEICLDDDITILAEKFLKGDAE